MATKEELKTDLAKVEKELESLKSTDKGYDKLWQKKMNLRRAIKNATE